MPNEYQTSPVVYANADVFDATTPGSHHVVTIGSGHGKFYPSTIYLETTDIVGLITLGIVAVGIISPNYNDIKGGIILAPNNPDRVRVVSIADIVPSLDEGAEVNLKITTGSLATEHLIKFSLEGVHAG